MGAGVGAARRTRYYTALIREAIDAEYYRTACVNVVVAQDHICALRIKFADRVVRGEVQAAREAVGLTDRDENDALRLILGTDRF